MAPPAAQTAPGAKASPEVDQALRARANAFLGYQSQGNFRKAYELVADDSKDYYFGATKEPAASFVIDDIQYSADLSTATVRSTMKRQTTLAGHAVELPQLLISQWKLEKGEWVWYHDPSKDVTKTIFGDVPAGPAGATVESPLPKDVSQKAALAAAAKIAPTASVDKKLVTFSMGKDATEQVTFHNSNPGVVQVDVEVRGVADTVTVEPTSSLLNPQADLVVKITYKSLKESSMRGVVRFTVEPFGGVYVLPVRIASGTSAPKPDARAVP
jgi:hypothetical protein